MSSPARLSLDRTVNDAALRRWFEAEVDPFLAEHAAALERLGKCGLYPIALVLLSFLAAVILAMAERFGPALACAAVLIPAAAVAKRWIPLYQAGGAAFRALFKQRVVAGLVARVLPGAAYEPDLAVAWPVLRASGLFDEARGYDGDDLVRGAIGRTPFALGDVRAGLRRAGSPAGRVHGLLFHAEFNRSLAGRTLVLAKGQAPAAVAANRGLEPVALENPAFAAAFTVHASDPVEARYVLTPRTMERLVALTQALGRPLSAAFDRRRVYVLLDNGRGAFEALAFGGEKAWDEVHTFAALFDGARAIVEELELNTRIWTKGFAPEAEKQAAASFQPSAWSRVAAQGAWAFQDDPSLPFSPDDRPVPPPRARARVERTTDGRLRVRFPGAGPLRFAVVTALGGGLMAVDPAWWAAHPALEVLGFFAQALRDVKAAALVIGGSLAVAVLYTAAGRVRWMEAREGEVRLGRLGPARRLQRGHLRRVFAAEDLVMALVEGSWTPVPLSPRLGAHGAAVWLAGEIERAMGGGRQ